MAKSKKGRLLHISAHVEPMKDSTGKQGYSVRVHKHFHTDDKEHPQTKPADPEEEKSMFAPSRKHAIDHVRKHFSTAMAEHEGVDADGDYDGDKGPSLIGENDFRRAIPKRKAY